MAAAESQSMPERILTALEAIDYQAFVTLHHALVSDEMDGLMVAFSSAALGIGLLLAIMAFRIIRSPKFGLKESALIIVTLGITDATAGLWLKPMIGRLRPCKVLASIREVASCSGEWSLPSNHAANMAAVAMVVFFMGRFPDWLVRLLLALALITGFSRIYLAQHYPFDILTGFVWGSLMAYLVIQLAQLCQFFHPSRS